jgi:hypothetical protein
VNNLAVGIKTLDPGAKPTIFHAGNDKALISRLGFHASLEVLRENDLTIWPD